MSFENISREYSDIIGEMGVMYTLMSITNVRARIERNERVIKKSEEEKKQNAVPFDNA